MWKHLRNSVGDREKRDALNIYRVGLPVFTFLLRHEDTHIT